MKKIITTIVTIGLLSTLFACYYPTSKCGDMNPDGNLGFSFTILDDTGENILHFFDEDTISIYKENFPDSIASFGNSYFVIDFGLKENFYIGKHNQTYHIYWKKNDIDTLQVIYSIGDIPEDKCHYLLEDLHVFFNGVEYYNSYNESTYKFLKNRIK